jgi:hypothetical protein
VGPFAGRIAGRRRRRDTAAVYADPAASHVIAHSDIDADADAHAHPHAQPDRNSNPAGEHSHAHAPRCSNSDANAEPVADRGSDASITRDDEYTTGAVVHADPGPHSDADASTQMNEPMRLR